MYHLRTRTREVTSSRNYLVDFKRVKRTLGRDVEALYFYPHEMEGFAESCVLSTQRDEGVVSRDIAIYHELRNAMDDWHRRVEDAMWRKGKEITFGNGISLDEREMSLAMNVGAIIDDYVLDEMSIIRDAHGQFSVDPKQFQWTESGSLIVPVHF